MDNNVPLVGKCCCRQLPTPGNHAFTLRTQDVDFRIELGWQGAGVRNEPVAGNSGRAGKALRSGWSGETQWTLWTLGNHRNTIPQNSSPDLTTLPHLPYHVDSIQSFGAVPQCAIFAP